MGNVLKDNIESLVEETPDKRKYNSRSILKLIPKKEHHNTTFVCQAQNQAERTYRSAKLRLQVKYAPKVRTCTFLVPEHVEENRGLMGLEKAPQITHECTGHYVANKAVFCGHTI